MEEQQQNIDDLFRQSLGDYREAPPAAAWGDLERRLDEHPGKPRSFFRWPWIVALVVLFTIGGVWYARHTRHAPEAPVPVPVAVIAKPALPLPPSAVPESGDSAASEAHKQLQEGEGTPEPATSSSGSSGHHNHHHRQGPKHHPAVAGSGRGIRRSTPSVAATDESHPSASARSHHGQRGVKKHTPTSTVAERNKAGSKSSSTEQSEAAATEKLPAQSRHAHHTAKQEASRSAWQAPGIPTAEKVAEATGQDQPATPGVTAHRPHPKRVAAAQATGKSTKPAKQRSDSQHQMASATGQDKPAQEQAIRNSTTQKPSGATKQLPHIPGAVTPAAAASSRPALPARPAQARSGQQGVTGKKLPAKTAAKPQQPVAQAPKATSQTAENIPKAASPVPASSSVQEAEDEQEAPDTPGGGAMSGEGAGGKHRRHKSFRFSAPVALDVKAGYEWGFQKPAAGRGMAGISLSLQLGQLFSLGIEPAYRFGSISNQLLSGAQTFGNVSPVRVDSNFTTDTFGRINQYVINQTYDSIQVPATSAGGKIWEAELPLLLYYQPGNWRLYGGPSFNFGGRIASSTSGTQRTYTVRLHDSLTLRNQQLPSDTFEHYFSLPTLTPISSYSGAGAGDPASLRIGYVLGISYQWRGFLADLSLHQQLTGLSSINQALRGVYGPYLRLSLGYRLFGPRPRRPGQSDDEKKALQRL